MHKKRYYAWRRRVRLLRLRVTHWRDAWQREMAKCDALYEMYMEMLDRMTDEDGHRFSFTPAALQDEGLEFDDLWRQHTMASADGNSWSYVFEA